ncbi:uncharacterized protein [Solanum tuberosum]|uniref:uncharacterized protein n=1 Tax=Solanum tuberosum TaxID=4113 RepID=UPI00073A2455|nr:PREDICTED: uncharacterized protein LOC107060813 [Solanum tuberosum]
MELLLLVPILCVILIPGSFIWCAICQMYKKKPQASDVEIGGGASGLRHGNLVLLAGAGAAAVAGGAAAVVGSSDRDKGYNNNTSGGAAAAATGTSTTADAGTSSSQGCCCGGGGGGGGGCGGCGGGGGCEKVNCGHVDLLFIHIHKCHHPNKTKYQKKIQKELCKIHWLVQIYNYGGFEKPSSFTSSQPLQLLSSHPWRRLTRIPTTPASLRSSSLVTREFSVHKDIMILSILCSLLIDCIVHF